MQLANPDPLGGWRLACWIDYALCMSESKLPPLPDGVFFKDGPSPRKIEGLRVLEVTYKVHGLHVVIGWTVHPPQYFEKPDRLAISPNETIIDFLMSGREAMTADEELMYGGVSTAVLRAIPMAHARALMRSPYERLLLESVQESLSPLPVRVESDEDYVHVSAAYVDLVSAGSVEPIKRLAEWSGEKAKTWSARLGRARSRGILTGMGNSSRISDAYQVIEASLRAGLSSEDAPTERR